MITDVLMRDCTLEVQDTDGTTFVEVGGLNSITHSPSKGETDTTKWSNQGRKSHLPTSRGDSFTASGFRLEDMETGERDAGQARVEALGVLVGPSGLGTYRITSPGGTTLTFAASVNVTSFGGGTDDAAEWSADLVVSGHITKAAPVVAP